MIMIEKIRPYVNAIVFSALVVAGVLGYNYITSPAPDVKPTPANPARIILPDTIEIEVGELGILDATKSKGVSFVWECIPKGLNVQVYADGRKLMFSSAQVGTYTCIVSSAYNDYIDQKLVTVIVHPINYDPDAPTPGPAPPGPDDGTLMSKVHIWAQSVRSLGKVSEAKALAEAFDRVAVQIEAGTVTTTEGVQEATRKATQAALGPFASDWKSFLDNLQTYIKIEKRRGVLVTVEDHVRVWREIAAALKTVRS